MSVTPTQLELDNAEWHAECDRRLTELFEANGYTRPGENDLPVRERALLRPPIVKFCGKHQVGSKKERYDKGGRFVGLIAEVFPKDLVGPSVFHDIEDDDDRRRASALWKNAVDEVRAVCKTVALEKAIEEQYGMTLCRVVLHPDDEAVEFVYITDDIGCILQDYQGPRNEQIKRAYQSLVKAMEPVLKRHPQHGKRLIAEFKKVQAKQLETSTTQLQLALSMGSNSNDNGAEPDDE